MSPKKVKVGSQRFGQKRTCSLENPTNKRTKWSNLPCHDPTVFSVKKRNFVEACKQVSYNAYYNYAERFNLLSLPVCATSACIHQDSKNCNAKQAPDRIEELFKIEMKSNMWYEALDVAFLTINPSRYLSHNILKDIIEIILNAHEDSFCNYKMSNLLLRSQQILSLHYSMHPPCPKTKNIRKCYIDFLTSPMDLKENTFTDRSKFEYSKGLVKYCLNRLEAELEPDTNEEALFNRLDNTPDEMKNNVQGIHWQKENFEIYEMLHKNQRIERLIVILESTIELIQFDLSIWRPRYTNTLVNRPIMAVILWSKNILCTGAVTKVTKQILQLFVNLIHLQYPERHIQTMQLWLNCLIQTFYIYEHNSNSDYPNIGKKTSLLASIFYKIITALPHTSIIRILEKIQPSFMRFLITKQHLQSILPSSENEIIEVLINFIKNRQWEEYCKSEDKPVLKEKTIKPSKLLNHLTNKCVWVTEESRIIMKQMHPNLFTNSTENDINQNDVIYLLFLTLQALLDAYSLQNVQETWDTLNDQLDQEILTDSRLAEMNTYSISENFVKKYKSIFEMLKELVKVFHQLKNDGMLPEILTIFTTINILGLKRK